ncbi:MAG: YcaQ family DNA glycosylase [Gammaproteobacteria bacterium]|nr:YcaQ family DNA glycosylase [Gammaproteobacteria bacterium]
MAVGESPLSQKQARALHLAALGLLHKPRRKAGKADVLAAVRRMSALQIDTIHVVARSPYLVLWSRLGDYAPAWLDELLAEGALFEYWSHEACFLPREDYGLYRHRMRDPGSMGWKYSHAWMAEHGEAVARLKEHIRANGPVRSADFERKDGHKGGGWWSWKPEKRSLEILFTAGELMVARRQAFQRVYDLRERVMPDWDDARDLRPERECLEDLWCLAAKALGIAKASWLGDYFRTGAVDRRVPDALCGEGRLKRVAVDGWDEPGYVHGEAGELLGQARDHALKPRLTTLLSPFDPLVWDRRRAREFFGFDYRLECYTPAEKRQHGYFVLPILHGDALAGRLDAKAHRAEGLFEVKALYLEPGTRQTQKLLAELAAALRACARWHGCERVAISAAQPADFGRALRVLMVESE